MLILEPETATNSRVLHHHKDLTMMTEKETERKTMMASSADGVQCNQLYWVESLSGGGPQLSLCPISTGHSPPSGPVVDRGQRSH